MKYIREFIYKMLVIADSAIKMTEMFSMHHLYINQNENYKEKLCAQVGLSYR